MPLHSDTIVAIATPPGRGGIGVVRLSGPQARAIAEPLLRLGQPLAHAQARLASIVDASGNLLDQAVVTFFQAPTSYTSEDVVEISAHGSPVLLQFLLRSSVANGARLAEPGEFTQRAFLSGRLDLTQAEAVNDLISAHTLEQAKLAASQLGGALSRTVQPIKAGLLDLIAALEAGVDFAEDDLDLLPETELLARLENLRAPLQTLAETFRFGRILRDGVRLAIVGRPNAGKSSLFNRLLGRDRAIVTPHPGTTRDLISEVLNLAGIPVELVDTAGLRDIPASAETEAEREGIARSRTSMADADLVLHVIDATLGLNLSPEDGATQLSLEGRPSLLVYSKSDLTHSSLGAARDAILTSATTGAGIEALKQAILDLLQAHPHPGSALITNLRQAEALNRALASISKAAEAASHQLPHEFLLLDLHDSLNALDELTGATTPDDILNRIFAGFCIGK